MQGQREAWQRGWLSGLEVEASSERGRMGASGSRRRQPRLAMRSAHLEVLGGVARQLEHLGGEVLCDRRTSVGRGEGRASR